MTSGKQNDGRQYHKNRYVVEHTLHHLFWDKVDIRIQYRFQIAGTTQCEMPDYSSQGEKC